MRLDAEVRDGPDIVQPPRLHRAVKAALKYLPGVAPAYKAVATSPKYVAFGPEASRRRDPPASETI